MGNMKKYRQDIHDLWCGKGFANKVTITRTYLTHHDEDLKDIAATGEELSKLTQKLQLLIKMILLFELGFEQKQIETMIKRTDTYRMLFS